jgi:hypothetical protein
MLDDEAKGNLASGTVTLSGVAEGRHTLAIEAKDYQRYETSITVRNGETLPHTATLVEMSKKTATVSTGEPISVEGTEGSKGGSNIWKPVFYGTAAVTVAAAGFSVLAYFEGQSKADNITSKQVSHDNCTNQAEAGLTNPLEVDALSSACSWYNRTRVGWVVTGVVGAAAVGSFIMAFVRDREHTETRTASGGHRKRRELAITPVISPDGGGATVRFDW